jgi:hypothetical protein
MIPFLFWCASLVLQRTIVFAGGLLALFIGYVMAAYSKTWLDSLSLLPLLFAAVILPVYAAVAIQDARRLERG